MQLKVGDKTPAGTVVRVRVLGNGALQVVTRCDLTGGYEIALSHEDPDVLADMLRELESITGMKAKRLLFN